MKSLAIAALAAGGIIIAVPAVANADSQVEGSYATLEGCEADGAGGDGNTDDAAATASRYGNNYHEVNTDDGVYYRYRAHDDDFYALDADGGRRGMMRNTNTGDDDDDVVVPLLDFGRSLTGMETRKVSGRLEKTRRR